MRKPRTQQDYDDQLVTRVNAVIADLGRVVKLVEERPDLLDQERLKKVEVALINQAVRAVQRIQTLVTKHTESLKSFSLAEAPEPILPIIGGVESPTASVTRPRAPRVPANEGVDFIDPDEEPL